jgi:hypothetical protein
MYLFICGLFNYAVSRSDCNYTVWVATRECQVQVRIWSFKEIHLAPRPLCVCLCGWVGGCVAKAKGKEKFSLMLIKLLFMKM